MGEGREEENYTPLPVIANINADSHNHILMVSPIHQTTGYQMIESIAAAAAVLCEKEIKFLDMVWPHVTHTHT